MKLYIAPSSQTDQMHLEIDHGLNPVEITEEDILEIIEKEVQLYLDGSSYRVCGIEGDKDAARIIISMLKNHDHEDKN